MSHFFAMLSRMKYIRRWGLMRNTQEENIQEHTLQTAMIAYHLAVLRNRRFGGDVNPERAAVLAMYHDVTEIFTGDMPTPVKYFTPLMRETYGQIERLAGKRIIDSLPDDLQSAYEPLILDGEEDPVWPLVKAAYTGLEEKLYALHMPEVDTFMKEYAPAFLLSLDEMNT